MTKSILDPNTGQPIRPPVNIDTLRNEIGQALGTLIAGIGPTPGDMMRTNGLADKLGAFVPPNQRLTMWSLPILEKIAERLEKVEERAAEIAEYCHVGRLK